MILGFAFGNGGFQASDTSTYGSSDDVVCQRDFVAPAPAPGSLDETLLRTGIPVFALDLKGIASERGPAGEWLRATHVTRNTGIDFNDDPRKHRWWELRERVHEQYDGLLFVARTTPARPKPGFQAVQGTLSIY